MRRMKMAGMVLVLAMGAAGAAASAGAVQTTSGPPNLLASAGGAITPPMPALRACWDYQGQGSLCFDDFPTGDEPLLTVPPGGMISLGFTAGAPLAISVTWTDAANVRQPVPQIDPHLVAANFPLGIHRVIVNTRWTQGTADYLFRVQVATTPAPPVRAPLDRTG